ncbi:MAG: hypothetical protein JSR80_05840 [Verrucomicrobia bacterium]|nr:hypothetical protein [Verrucomicrobiota bacterium]
MKGVVTHSFAMRGELSQLLLLFFPLLGTAFSSYLFLLLEKIFLARLSAEAMEVAVNAAYVCQIFQGSTTALAMMTQVFVGRWYGANTPHAIGPGVWQFIWFSFFSMVITVPGSLLLGKWYFQGTGIEEIARPYFYLLLGGSFLYPLGMTLSSFYLGLGRIRLVLLSNLAVQCFKIALCYLLIFGWSHWVPPLGLIGGAVSGILAQGFFCLFLGGIFISSRYATLFHSRKWHFQPRLFWECMRPGLLRAINRISNLLSWASITHLMVAQGGEYLLVLSIGGSVLFFLPCFNDALCQAQTTIVSQLLGAGKFFILHRAFRSGIVLVLGIIVLMSLPFVVFPSQTFHFLFPLIMLDQDLQNVSLGIWTSFAFFTLNAIPLSYILAFKDMKFSLFMGLMNWVNGYLLMYFALEHLHIRPNEFWLVLSLMHATTWIAYYWRARKLSKEAMSNELVLT